MRNARRSRRPANVSECYLNMVDVLILLERGIYLKIVRLSLTVSFARESTIRVIG